MGFIRVFLDAGADAKSSGGFSLGGLGFGGSAKVDAPEVDVGADLSAGRFIHSNLKGSCSLFDFEPLQGLPPPTFCLANLFQPSPFSTNPPMLIPLKH